jgi:hypothetical protein
MGSHHWDFHLEFAWSVLAAGELKTATGHCQYALFG